MEEFDTKLLLVFLEIYRTRNLSRAAENLVTSQPTISFSLAKLRTHFKDRLFVRTGKGMEPTAYAHELVAPIQNALDGLRNALGHQAVFDPLSSSRSFNICMTDISQINLLPILLNRLRVLAPKVKLRIHNISGSTAAMLTSGEADLAVGFMPQLDRGFFQQNLFEQDFVCLVRRDHSRIKKTLSLEQFKEEGHLLVTTSGTGHWIIDKHLKDLQIERKIMLELPTFLGLLTIVEQTDLIAIIPRRLGELLQGQGKIKLLPPPVVLPHYFVKQHWHERFHHDLGNRWLRALLMKCFSGVSDSEHTPKGSGQ